MNLNITVINHDIECILKLNAILNKYDVIKFHYLLNYEDMSIIPSSTDLIFVDTNTINQYPCIIDQIYNLYDLPKILLSEDQNDLNFYKCHCFARIGYTSIIEDLRICLKELYHFKFYTRLRKTTPLQILCTVKTHLIQFHMSDILYLRLVDRKMYLSTKEGTFEIKESFRQLEPILLQYGFYRVNRNYLVNMSKVLNINEDTCLLMCGILLKRTRTLKTLYDEI